MSYVSQPTKWPFIPMDQNIQGLIAGFYELADNKTPNAGVRLANEIFAPSGKLVAATGAFHGSEEISRSRDNAWGKVTASRYQVLQVFTHDAEGRDLMVIGTVRMSLWKE